MARRYNDLEAGFEKHLALSYGRHIITGHPVEHSVGLEGGAASTIADADKRVVLKVALGDGAIDIDGEGAWCGPEINIAEGNCTAESLEVIDDWSSLENLTLEEDGSLEKSEGSMGVYDAHAYSRTIAAGDCFNVQCELTELKHTQRWVLEVEDLDGSPGDGCFFTTQFGDNPFFSQVINDVAAALISYEFPLGIRILGNANGTGNISFNVGGIPPDQDWSGALGVGFTFDETKAQRVHVSVAGLDGVPVPVVPPISLAASRTGIEPGGTCSMEVIYAGETIPPENWHFHPGTLSNGVEDVIQGIDAFFPNGLTYNATAYITVLLPDGFDEDADASKLAVIVWTSQVGDYDEDGVRTAIGISVNPSRVKANMLRRIGQHGRIRWSSYISSRDYYDEEIEAPVGTDNSYAPFDDEPDYDAFGPISADAGTGAIARTGGSGYDNKAVTRQRIVGGEDGSFSATLGDDFPTGEGGGEMHLVDEEGTAWFGVSWGNGHLGVFANGVAIEDPTDPYDLPAAGGDEIELAVDDGFFILKQNGVVKTIPQGEAPAPDDVDLFGRIVLWDADAAVTASHFTGAAVDEQTTATEMIPRFEAHPAFTGPVDIATALDFVDFLCASETQDAGRYIVFLTPEERASVHTFDDEVNVVGGTVKVYPTDIRNRPNRLWAKFRNLDLRYLDQDSVFDLRDELFDKVGRPIDPGALNFSSMRTSLAQRMIRFEMRRRSDNKIWCELIGMDDSFKVLPGDVVTVITRKFGRVPKDFLVIRATRESPEALPSGLRRNFVLHEYFPDDYSDTDHEVPQPPVNTQVPSPFAGPTSPVLQLAQSTVAGVGGALITKVLGTVYFAVGAAQIAKIYVETPTLAEAYTGITVTPASGSNVGTFEYFPTETGLYTFRAEAIVVATGVVGGSTTKEIVVGDLLINPATGEFLHNPVTNELLTAG